MRTKVLDFINENEMLSKCHRVVVGLSGGADSVCLLVILKELCEEKGIELLAVHINHGIRGEEANRDEAYCRTLCDKLSIKFLAYHFDVPTYAKKEGLSTEEAGRVLRYKAFREAAGNEGVIAVAHHKNDQAETVLFNLVRGTKLKGASGMSPVRDGIIRPLLNVTREEIEAFLRDNNIEFCVDGTNASNEYSRNAIRNQIIPALLDINEKAVEHISDFASGVAEAEEFLSALTDEYYKRVSNTVDGRILLDVRAEKPYIAKRLVRKAFEQMHMGLKDVTEVHISEIMKLAFGKIGAYKHIKDGVCVENTRDGLLFYNEADIKPPAIIEVKPPVTVELGGGKGAIEFSVKEWNNNKKITNLDYTKILDYDKIKVGLQLRGWQQGDVIAIDDKGHHKKLKQYFVDEHIPRVCKEEILLLADGSNIMWVVGGRIGADYKVSDSTNRVLEVRYIGGQNGEN